jgi:phosphoglycolate phosphatase
VDALAARYRALYPELGVAPTTLLPGAGESVAQVHRLGGRVVVVSAKLEPGVTAVLRHVGLDRGLLAVDAVSGGLFGADKSRVLAEEGADVFVGDHPGDVAAARGAGAVPVGVTTGAHDGQQLLAAGAQVVLPGLTDFPALVRRWAVPGSATRVGCACGSECDAENR